MRLPILSALVFALFSPASARAEIRLDRSPVMAAIPVMDQGNTGLCSAFATAQMIDAYRFSHGDKDTRHLTSPIHLASRSATIELRNPRQKKMKGMDYRYPWTILQETKTIGSCSHEKIMHAYNQAKPEDILSTLPSLLNSSDVRSKPAAIARVFRSLAGSPVQDTPEERFICEYLSAFKTNDFNLYPSLEAVRLALMQADPLVAVDALISDTCKDAKKNLPALPHVIIEAADRSQPETKKILDAVDTSLTAKNPQPAGVVLCLTALKKKGFKGIANNGRLNAGCEYHVAVVVGRRERSGQQEYLVRNSMGDACYRYDRECERGQVWVPADELAANSTHAYYFKGD